MMNTITYIKKYNITMVQLAQAFVNSRPFVTSNIIGATTMEQLKENIRSIDIELTEEIFEKINLIHNNNPNPSPIQILKYINFSIKTDLCYIKNFYFFLYILMFSIKYFCK